jgi:dihydrofolate reductase
MQAPGGPNEDHDGGFQHGGWLVPYFDAKFVEIMTEWTKRASAFLLGRKTYEMFADSWPKSTDPADEIAVALNTRPKFVASRTLDKVNWNNSILLKGDVAQEVAKLKAQESGEIQVHGSSNLIQTLLKNDLVDTLRIWQFPVVLGAGKRLFEEGAIPRSFRLLETQLNTTGAVLHVYERVGGLKYGEVEVGQETVIFDEWAPRG